MITSPQGYLCFKICNSLSFANSKYSRILSHDSYYRLLFLSFSLCWTKVIFTIEYVKTIYYYVICFVFMYFNNFYISDYRVTVAHCKVFENLPSLQFLSDFSTKILKYEKNAKHPQIIWVSSPKYVLSMHMHLYVYMCVCVYT